MSDITAGQATGGNVLGYLMDLTKRGDLMMAIGVLFILVILIFPMPPLLVDLMLAVSIITSVMILMTSLFIHKPLEFSSFPTVLLISAMLRLSLNLASTRLILSKGHEGTAAAGHVIEAFGNFVMGGNFLIGIIVFVILLIVNFVVITKGSGRIAEVAARFSLDAMPGKQMAIDADLSAGLIDEAEAKARRKELESESAFFGAMDGASKFVKGDAIAALLITFINIIGGLVIGVAQMGLPFTEAARTYTILTVGDGLVSQIPALIISTAAGLLVTKAGVSGSADQAMIKQLSNYPKALALSAGVMGLMAFLPGIPFIPFFGLASLAGYAAYSLDQAAKAEIAALRVQKEEELVAAAGPPAEEPISSALKIDDLKIELGYGLLPLVQSEGGSDRLTDQIKALRRQLASDMGFVMPSVRILDNVQLQPSTYIIRVKEVEAGTGQLWPHHFMVMDPMGGQVDMPGIHTTEPTFGLPATWVEADDKEEASVRGYTVVDAATVLSTHLTEILKGNVSELLSYGEVQKLIKELPTETAELVKDLVPAQIAISGIQRVLQVLLNERVSIRDLPTILEGIAEAVAFTRNANQIAEHVRQRLARQLCAQYLSHEGHLSLIAMTAQWEQAFADSIVGQGDDRQLAMQPSKLSEFIMAVRDAYEDAAKIGEAPVLLTSPGIRPFVRSIVERFRAQTPVLSQAEIHPRVRLKTVGSI